MISGRVNGGRVAQGEESGVRRPRSALAVHSAVHVAASGQAPGDGPVDAIGGAVDGYIQVGVFLPHDDRGEGRPANLHQALLVDTAARPIDVVQTDVGRIDRLRLATQCGPKALLGVGTDCIRHFDPFGKNPHPHPCRLRGLDGSILSARVTSINVLDSNYSFGKNEQ